MTQWVDGLEPAHIPGPFRPSSRHLHPPDVNLQTLILSERNKILGQATNVTQCSSLSQQAKGLLDEEGQRELKDLAQWSDLVIFDYLTANLDRVVNNLYNMQWNTGMMDAPAHNLARQTATGLLVFLDNESGLLHGFRLLDKYEPYHRKLLDSLCVFRRSTVENLEKLSRSDVATEFSKRVSEAHPDMSDALPPLPDKYARILAERIRTVLNHVRGCERIYDSS
ncbi:unnamed protein product [Notodromas monacha]|uniref:Uncharacterized protein n=1 Tax=Notodromas monacha TaxID=399045 RepID=A0A7R9BRK7_9CRUS|nr:unnamed protein product [Notodromas monacha]CAG0920386.1 unnamed protein product [Notodromas monacha]